jgi:long-subunit acyl-CoA synthetase (AMP-forming)
LTNVEAKLLLVHPNLVLSAVEAAAKVGLPRSRIFQFDDREAAPQLGVQDWRVLLGTSTQGVHWSWPHFTPAKALSMAATINYSSGTTGPPKGVMVSHANLIANATQSIFVRNLHRPRPLKAERWIGFLPLYHAYGQLYSCLIAVKLNTPVYVMKAFVYRDFLQGIQDYRITELQLAPPVLVMLSKRPETKEYDISSVAHVMCGAAPLSKELQNDCSRKYGFNIVQAWGMTEVTCGGISVPGGDVDDTGSIGQLLPNTECKLLDDDGREVKVGEPGELFLRGPQVCLGYWRNEAATKETLGSDGWLKTGDVAVCNEKGMFWIVDRKKVGSREAVIDGMLTGLGTY